MSTYQTIKQTVYSILDPGHRETRIERAGNRVLGVLIILNVLAVILESVQGLHARHGDLFAQFEAFSVVVFSVEYMLRVWSCTVVPRYQGHIKGRLRFMVSPMALIDLAAIVPAYLPGDAFLDLRYARAVRLVRMFRALKAARYSRSVQTFTNVFREREADLVLITWLLLLLLVVASSSMYFAEHAAQPQTFSSIPAAMWWGVVTLTTVGYGDIYPVTPLGKFLGAIIALIGIGLFALPAGILASGFADELQKRKARKERKCPHCGALVPE